MASSWAQLARAAGLPPNSAPLPSLQPEVLPFVRLDFDIADNLHVLLMGNLHGKDTRRQIRVETEGAAETGRGCPALYSDDSPYNGRAGLSVAHQAAEAR